MLRCNSNGQANRAPARSVPATTHPEARGRRPHLDIRARMRHDTRDAAMHGPGLTLRAGNLS